MLAQERLYEIARYLREHKRARVEELATHLDVSRVTIRNDLEKLHKQGIIEKVHGGAIVTEHFMPEFNFREKIVQNFDAKMKIAKVCSEMIKDGDSLILDAGTTTFQIARMLKQKTGLHIITNSLPIITEMMSNPDVKITILGGELRPVALSMVDSFAYEKLEKIRVAKAFLGAMGVDIKAGFTSSNLLEAQTKQRMMNCARETFIVASFYKMGKIAPFHFAGFKDVTALITDDESPARTIRELRKKGLKVIIAK